MCSTATEAGNGWNEATSVTIGSAILTCRGTEQLMYTSLAMAFNLLEVRVREYGVY